MATFNDLPIEVQQMIFFNLPINEVLHRCKLVCRSWSQIINWMRYNSISIVKKYPYPFLSMYSKYLGGSVRDSKLCYIYSGFSPSSLGHIQYDLIKTNFLVNLKSADGLLQLHRQAIFKNIKKMTTSFANLPDFKVLNNFYSYFEKLEELTFDSKRITGPRLPAARIVLDQKSLKKVAVYNDMFEFHFKTPNLTSLKTVCYQDGNFYFEFPQSLQFLEAYDCHEGSRFPSLFTNLKTLVIQKGFHIYADNDFLQRIPNLKELFFGYDYPELEQLTAKLNGDRKLNIFVLGVHRDDLKYSPLTLTEANSSISEKTRALMVNLPWINERNYHAFEIDYNALEKLSGEEMDELNKKIGKVNTVLLNDPVVNQEGLVEFLRRKPPARLEIQVYTLDSIFFGKISKSCQLLREIHLHAKESTNWAHLEFVFKLENLARIEISNAFSMCFCIKLVETKQSLEFIYFLLNSYEVSMTTNFTINELYLIGPESVLINGPRLKGIRFETKELFLDYLKLIQPKFVGQFENEIEKFFRWINNTTKCNHNPIFSDCYSSISYALQKLQLSSVKSRR